MGVKKNGLVRCDGLGLRWEFLSVRSVSAFGVWSQPAVSHMSGFLVLNFSALT